VHDPPDLVDTFAALTSFHTSARSCRRTYRIAPSVPDILCDIHSAPHGELAMSMIVETITIDCVDPDAMARFWCGLLDYQVVPNYTDSIQTADPIGKGPRLLFTPSGGLKTTKNRFHLDLRPTDRDAEVRKAISLGATTSDVGQTGKETWVVLADPEGNEFCILQSLTDRANRP
jgi:hypothetical protein